MPAARGGTRAELPIGAIDRWRRIWDSERVIPRSPTADERSFVERLLAFDFDGVEALRAQWARALVEPSCACGCGSIRFVFVADAGAPPSTARNPLPVEAEVLDANGDVVGGVIVLVRGGLLDDIDVYTFGDAPLQFPPPGPSAGVRSCRPAWAPSYSVHGEAHS